MGVEPSRFLFTRRDPAELEKGIVQRMDSQIENRARQKQKLEENLKKSRGELMVEKAVTFVSYDSFYRYVFSLPNTISGTELRTVLLYPNLLSSTMLDEASFYESDLDALSIERVEYEDTVEALDLKCRELIEKLKEKDVYMQQQRKSYQDQVVGLEFVLKQNERVATLSQEKVFAITLEMNKQQKSIFSLAAFCSVFGFITALLVSVDFTQTGFFLL